MDKQTTVLEGAIDDARHLYDVRYLTISGCVVLIYDLLITFPKEARYVWSKRHFWLVKLSYAMNRYGVTALSIFYLSFIIPSRKYTDEMCNNAASAVIVVDIVTATFGNGLVLYQLIRLWQSSKYIAWLMALGFAIVHSITVVYAGFSLAEMKGNVRFVDNSDTLRACIVGINPKGFRGVYIPAVILDVYCFTLLLLNALARPRSSTQTLRDILYGDGVIFFMTTLSMRLLNLILNSVAPPSIAVLCLNFGSSIVATAVARLFLRLRESEERLMKQHIDSLYGEESLLSDGLDYQVQLQHFN